MNSNYISERITELRMEKGISEYKLSLDLGQSRTYIGKIASGKINPSMSALFLICEYFQITPAQFFCKEINKETEELLQIFCGLSEEDKHALMKIADALKIKKKD